MTRTLTNKYLANISAKDAARFFSKYVERDQSECWIWEGTTSGIDIRKYGKIKIARVDYLATHVALHLHTRPRRGREIACHKCDNTLCVNPAHLYWGTHRDNAFDCSVRGRRHDVSGRRNGHFRLTPEVREAIAKSADTNRALAKRYRVGSTTVFRIKHGLIGW